MAAGFEDERGSGPGEGYNIKVPMHHGSPESALIECLEEALAAIRLFRPDFVPVVTLRFGIYKEGPQGFPSRSDPAARREATQWTTISFSRIHKS